jgi:hypothetical protein
VQLFTGSRAQPTGKMRRLQDRFQNEGSNRRRKGGGADEI